MKSIRNELAATFIIMVLLILLMFFWALYYFIGKNAQYMFKTQNQINSEIISILTNSTVQDLNQDTVRKAIQRARFYNVGISITLLNGITGEWQPDNSLRMARLEFWGRYITKQTFQGNDKEVIKLTYFRPFLAGDDTLKVFPAFWRLAALFLILALMLSGGVAWVAAISVRNDIKQARTITSNLVKGSRINNGRKATYREVGALLDELGALREIVVKKELLKKRMTSDLAHELRTPLTTLQSHLEALIDGVWQPTRERFLSCHEEILRLIRLVGDLEKLSKVEDENIILDKSRFDITALLI